MRCDSIHDILILKNAEAFPYQQPGKSSVLLVTGRGLEPYTSLLANALASYVQVVVFGDSRQYLSEKIPFVQRATTLRRPSLPGEVSSSSNILGTLLWIVGDFLKYAVDTYYLAAAIRRLKPSFVHLQGHFPFFFVLIFGRSLVKNLFWTIHDVELRESRYGVMDRINVFLTKVTVMPALLGLRSKAIIVHGNRLKREISLSWWALDKTYSIPHGNYDGVYAPLLTAKAKTPIAMFFGKIKPYKGLDLFIQCAVNVSRKIPSARFVIAGAGDLTPYLDLINGAGHDLFEIQNRFIPDDEIPSLFARASVVVIPYTKGSQSGVLALAYTLGVPVVGSRVGSIPEIIDHGKTGFLFESGNVAEMSNYVYTLMTNRELCNEFSNNARQKASSALSWSEIARKTLTLYLNLGIAQ
jgi:glycosyltransferase involved in cell wall biosynthesis